MTLNIPLTVRDAARLDALAAYTILDTPPEPGFDDIVRLTARLCTVSVALVSLVAVDRQWFKARIGFPECETDLDSSVCKFVLTEPDLLVIPDLAADPRTCANPLVTGAPYIRFYAGAPLRTPEGHVLGSLCAIDTAPRPEGLTPEQADDLRSLARQTSDLLVMRRAVADRDAALAAQAQVQREREVLAETQAAVAAAGGDLAAILDAVTAGALLVTPAADGGVLEFLDGEELEYRCVRGSLVPHRGVRVPLNGSTSGACARTNEPILLVDADTDPRVKKDLAPLIDLRSAVHAPVTRGGKVLGVLKLQSREPDRFTTRDLDLVRLFAGVATAGLAEVAEREAVAALRESDARSRMAQKAGRIGTFEMDITTGRTRVSAEFCRLYGLTVAETVEVAAIEALILPEDRDLASDASNRSDGSAPRDTEYRVRRADDGRLRWISRRAEFARDAAGEVSRMSGTVHDVTERRYLQAQQAGLIALGDRLRTATESTAVIAAAAEILGRTLTASRAGYAHIDPAGAAFVIEQDWMAPGMASFVGRHRLSAYPAAVERLTRGETLALANVLSAPWLGGSIEAYDRNGVRALIDVPLVEHGALVGVLFVHQSSQRTWSPEEVAFAEGVADRTYAALAKVRAEERQDVLNHELSHRLKNTLAMVLSIAHQTLRAVPEREPVEAFERRVQALARAHDLLLDSSWTASPLRSVAEAVLGNFAQADRITLDGPDVPLGPRATLSVSLLLHELATNAAKYGSLSAQAGRIEVTWTVDGGSEPELAMLWRESGGPAAVAPTRRGFGSRLIRLGLIGTGGVEIDYQPSGLRALMRAPLAEVQRS